ASDGWLTLLPRYVRVRVCCATIIAPTAHERPVLDDHGPARPAVKDFGAHVAALELREFAECPCWARRPWAGVSPLNSKGGGGVASTNLSSSMGGSHGPLLGALTADRAGGQSAWRERELSPNRAVAHATFPPHRAGRANAQHHGRDASDVAAPTGFGSWLKLQLSTAPTCVVMRADAVDFDQARCLASTWRAKLLRMDCQPSRCCSMECVGSLSKLTLTRTPSVLGMNSTRAVRSPKAYSISLCSTIFV